MHSFCVRAMAWLRDKLHVHEILKRAGCSLASIKGASGPASSRDMREMPLLTLIFDLHTGLTVEKRQFLSTLPDLVS